MVQFLFQVIILFLNIFNFRVPIFYNSVVLSVVFVSFYYIFIKKSFALDYFFRRYNVVIFAGLLMMMLVTSFITVAHATYEFTLVRVLALQLFMLGALTYSLPILIPKKDEGIAFEKMSKIICYTFALQGLIQLTGFLIPSVGNFLISMKTPDQQEFLLNSTYNMYFRGYTLAGQAFFELPSGYGVAIILFFRMLLISDQKMITGYKIYVFLFIFLVGVMFSGRTAFVGLSMAVIMCLLLFKNYPHLLSRVMKYVVTFIVLSSVIFIFLINPNQRKALLNDVFPFAFEFYYNFKSDGTFRTSSTDVMIEDHYFSIPLETALKGDGIYNVKNGYYKNTDAGYMRYLLFGGVPYIIALIIYVSLYFISPLSIAKREKTREGRADFMCFLILYVYLFILNYKGTALGTQNITQVLLLAVGSSYMIRYYSRLSSNLIKK